MKIAFFGIEQWEIPIIKKTFNKDKLFFSKDPLSLKNINRIKDYDVVSPFIHTKLDKKILNKLPNLKLTDKQKNIINALIKKFSSIEWDPDVLHNEIYSVSENERVSIKTTFSTLYQILLGQNEGPRAGYFISNLDRDFVMKRLREAIK